MAYWRVTLASVSTLSALVVRTLRSGKGHPKNVLSRYIRPGASPQSVFDCLWLLFAKGTQWVCGGVQERTGTGSKARKEGCIHTIANGFAVFRLGKAPNTLGITVVVVVVV